MRFHLTKVDKNDAPRQLIDAFAFERERQNPTLHLRYLYHLNLSYGIPGEQEDCFSDFTFSGLISL